MCNRPVPTWRPDLAPVVLPGSGPIFYNDVLPQLLGELSEHYAGHHIGDATRSEGYNRCQWLGGPFLSLGSECGCPKAQRNHRGQVHWSHNALRALSEVRTKLARGVSRYVLPSLEPLVGQAKYQIDQTGAVVVAKIVLGLERHCLEDEDSPSLA